MCRKAKGLAAKKREAMAGPLALSTCPSVIASIEKGGVTACSAARPTARHKAYLACFVRHAA